MNIAPSLTNIHKPLYERMNLILQNEFNMSYASYVIRTLREQLRSVMETENILRIFLSLNFVAGFQLMSKHFLH